MEWPDKCIKKGVTRKLPLDICLVYCLLLTVDPFHRSAIFFHDHLTLQLERRCQFTAIDGPLRIQQFKFLHLLYVVEILVEFLHDLLKELDHSGIVEQLMSSTLIVYMVLLAPFRQVRHIGNDQGTREFLFRAHHHHLLDER